MKRDCIIVLKNIFCKSLIIWSLILVVSCRAKNESSDYSVFFSSGNIVNTARGFSIDRKENYSVVKIINPWQGADNIIMSHYLVKKGSKLPEGLDSSNVIFVPVSRIVCMSTTYIGMIEALGEENSIVGLSGKGLVYSEKISARVAGGYIGEVGYETSLNQEMIITMVPDLIMMYGVGSESAGHVIKMKEMGLKVMFNGDYLETDPLGKAEWVKLFGALFCKERMADSIFIDETNRYNQVRDYVLENSEVRPSVLLGLPFKDTWFISPGNSFVSKLIQDAGGDYLWKHTTSGMSMPYGLENVYINALDADYWLNIGTVTSSNEILLLDKRLSDLNCFKNKRLYNNNQRINPGGGNDYWERGTLRPHVILKDIASILHPDLFTGHELYFYRKIN